MCWSRTLSILMLVVLVFQVKLLAISNIAEEPAANDWVSRFTYVPPSAATEGICLPGNRRLPIFTVTPSANGPQLVRVSLPFAPGTFPAELCLKVYANNREIIPDIRSLTYHPGRPSYVRRAIVTFVYDFPDTASHEFRLNLAGNEIKPSKQPTAPEGIHARVGDMKVHLTCNGIEICRSGRPIWHMKPIIPSREWSVPGTTEIIEHGEHYLWLRILVPDNHWPRIIELRADSLGTVAGRIHVQSLLPGDGRAPDIGWHITGSPVVSMLEGNSKHSIGAELVKHSFSDGKEAQIQAKTDYLHFPDAHLKKRGLLSSKNVTDNGQVTYLRCRAEDQVPHQHAAWRTASFVLSKLATAPWTALLEPPHQIHIDPETFSAIYECGTSSNLSPWPILDKIRQFHIDAIAGCSLLGDDFGNITSLPQPGVFGMNRLNHCPAIFHEYYRSGDSRLRNVALLWCNNFYDLSIWWGTTGPKYFDHRSMTDWVAFANKMKSHSSGPQADAFTRIWKYLNEQSKQEIINISDHQTIETKQKICIANSLNEILKSRNLYEKTCWHGIELDEDVLNLLKKGIPNLTDDEVVILNRYLLEALFPNEILQSKPFHRSRFGGTRYNNMARHHQKYRDDKSFMWRSNSAVSFCTKGYDSFIYAYEETGDPRMATALRWQIEFAKDGIHADQGECRNIGDVLDFINLYRITGRNELLAEGLRLFRELRTRLSEGDLFSQGGSPIVKDPPFIDNDSVGYKHPFAKPYILGYALAGLPLLAEYFPDESKLRDVFRAVADFLAQAQDPVGGWRYPHPRSSNISVSQGIEHAAQLAHAVSFLETRGESVSKLLDAIERVLQARILAWKKSGKFFGGLRGWEASTGILGEGKNIHDLYKKPEDRDRKRDYTEGSVSLGNASPEAVVYFSEVLNFYLARRPAERLFNANPELTTVLERIKPSADYQPSKPSGDYPGYGVANKLPTFRDAIISRLSFSFRFDPQGEIEFKQWRSAARAKLLECLLVPPPRAEFEPVVIGREDRGTYEAQKIVFNVSADCRVPAYLLVPKGRGPFPAIIALHDHGAHFLIGKEKVIRPFDVSKEILTDAQRWVEKSYGNRFIGDELAKRGYVVFGMDALFWGERGLKEGVDYNLQQALASNLLQMGMTWIGVITWDDIRSAEFVASLPQVDPQRIGAVGLSMGCHRTWMLSAASDHIAAGIAVCWLGTTETLMSPNNNQTKGHSAYSMLVPNLRNYLDYPDVAAIACPKPMTFYNGEKDGLFPIAGVWDAYAVMRKIWESQGVSDRLVTKIWPGGHVFNMEMQEEAFDWLDNYLRPK